MASIQMESCEICMNTFNSVDRKAVTLPCAHDFCLTCLVRMKTAGSHKCPKCRGDWAEFEVQALPGMALGAEAQTKEDEDLLEKLIKWDDRCRSHELAYDFWSNKAKMFYCKKCIVEKFTTLSELQLIEDAVPVIKSEIAAKYVVVTKQLGDDLKAIDDFRDNFSEKLRRVSKYREKIQLLEEKLQDLLNSSETLRSQVSENTALAKKIDDDREKIKSDADIALMVSATATLEFLKEPCSLPALQEPESLLCSIACTYMESEVEEELPSSAAFISGLMEATENSALSLTQAAVDADKVKSNEVWVVDSSNCLAALLALADRQPRRLILRSRHDEPQPLPAAAVAAVAKAARNCEVWLDLYHSFLKPENRNTDRKLLEHFMNNSSLRLTLFYGHLDAAGIARLPTTVTELGLAIGSAADAAAVSGLTPWQKLTDLNVSVTSAVAACDLGRLPSVDTTSLFFPRLMDDGVDSVRPAIEALVPDLQLSWLVFLESHLTAAGAHRLLQQLRGVRIGDVTIDPRGSWRPGKAEKERIEEELQSAVGCNDMYWDMDWFY